MTVQKLAFNYTGLNVKPINRVMYEKERSTQVPFKKTSRSVFSGLKLQFSNLSIHDCEFFVNGFKISDIDQFILTLIFRFEVILVDVNFSRVFIRYKDTH